MEEIETLEKYEVTIKGTNGVGFQNVLIQQSEVEKLVASLKGKCYKELEEKDRRHKDELEKKDSKIGDLKSDLDNEKKNLARKLDELNKVIQSTKESVTATYDAMSSQFERTYNDWVEKQRTSGM